jgi:hypothetical protein
MKIRQLNWNNAERDPQIAPMDADFRQRLHSRLNLRPSAKSADFPIESFKLK